MNKVIRDGKVAVLLGSENWACSQFFSKNIREEMLFDSDIINLILEFEERGGSSRNGKLWLENYLVKIQDVAKEKYGWMEYFSEDDLCYAIIQWIDIGKKFVVDSRGNICLLEEYEIFEV